MGGCRAPQGRGAGVSMLKLSSELVAQINAHVEAAYPDEGAGFLLGVEGDVQDILALANAR